MNENALFELTLGLYILSTKEPNSNRFVGCIVDAVSQVAFSPNILAISCMKQNYTKQVLENSKQVALSVLPQNISPEIIKTFGYQSSKNVDKWERVPFSLKDNLPVYTESVAYVRGTVIDQKEFSSHTVFFVQVDDTDYIKKSTPLTYNYYREHIKEQLCATDNFTKEKWVCTICGYVYSEGTPFEELPEDWVCPVCGVKKDLFEKEKC